MIDIKYIRDNLETAKENAVNRHAVVNFSLLLELDDERNEFKKKIEGLRSERNKRSKTKPSDEEILLMRKLGDEIADLEDILVEKEEEIEDLLLALPNLTHDSVPVGKDEAENLVVRKVGEQPIFNFQPKEHDVLAEKLGLIDLITAGEVTGSRFVYLKGKLAQLQFALINHAISIITNPVIIAELVEKNKLQVSKKQFEFVIPPVMIRPEIMQKMGRLEPREERYHIDSDDLYLVGSAEHTLGPIYMDKTLKEEELPIRLLGYSTAFRREAGSYGKDTKGIFRVHQFDKLEMESFTTPEMSLGEQDLFVAIQEHLMSTLGIPYQVVLKCTGDMGLPDFREFDIESWLPGQGRYRETHTADLMTDFQSRRLNTRVKTNDGKVVFAHMNDATAYAIGRTLIAIIENYQTSDGHVRIPEVLQKHTGFSII